MGCDIHIMVEKLIGGQWKAVKGPNPDIARDHYYAELNEKRGDIEQALNYERLAAECESGELLKKRLDSLNEQYPETDRQRNRKLQEEYESEIKYYQNDSAPEVYHDWIYDGRNYDLFAILADVRNGHGFAGIQTGEGFIPISDPRGVPEDASAVYKSWVEQWDCDGHSHSYHTVRQLTEYPHCESGTVQYGIVSESEYKVFKEKGMPDSYAGGISGRDIVHVINEEMDDIISGKNLRENNKQYVTRVKWEEKYKFTVGDFYTQSIPKLKELSGDDLDSVRIVFFFDN